MEWIGIDFDNPLILLRLFLSGTWLLPGAWGVRTFWRLPRRSAFRPAVALTTAASLLGSASYFIGASTTFGSPLGFAVVAAMLGFTPFAVVTWFMLAQQYEDKTKRVK
jgi:hypothetical protein